MKLEDAKEISTEFAEIFWPFKERLNLDSILLYGSVVKDKPNPRDIDLMIIHKNPALDYFTETSKSKKMKDVEKLFVLQEILGMDLYEIVHGTKTLETIKKDLLNLNYMNKEFFSSQDYRENWNNENKKSHGHLSDHRDFVKNVMKTGLIWDEKTKTYSISPKEKYSVKESILENSLK